MAVKTEEVGSVLVVDPGVKRIDATVAVALKKELNEILAAGYWAIAVDLGNVDFIDSSGLGSLAAVRKQLGSSGRFGLFSIQGTVRGMFKLTRMDKVFKIYDGRQDAVTALSA